MSPHLTSAIKDGSSGEVTMQGTWVGQRIWARYEEWATDDITTIYTWKNDTTSKVYIY